MRYSFGKSRLIACAVATLLLTGAAGCTGSNPSSGANAPSGAGSHANGHGGSKKHGTTSTAKPVPAGKPKKVPTSKTYQVPHQPGTGKGYVGAAKDVKLSDCTSRKGATNFSGTVANPTGSVQSYRIYVAVTGKKGKDNITVGIAEVDVGKLAGKAKAKWHGSLGDGVKGATCVLRVERQKKA